MPRSPRVGPAGTNRITLDAQHLVRYWRAELGCSEDDLRDAIVTVGVHAADVRRYLERARRAQQAPMQQRAAQR